MSDIFINWVASNKFVEIIKESNPMVKEYGEIMEKLTELQIPSSSNIKAWIRPQDMFKECSSQLDILKRRIKDLDSQVSNWQNRATKIYAEPNFPVGLDNEKTELYFQIQQNYILHRMSQLSDSLRTLYYSINTKSDELQNRIDTASNYNLFAISIIISWILFILSYVVRSG